MVANALTIIKPEDMTTDMKKSWEKNKNVRALTKCHFDDSDFEEEELEVAPQTTTIDTENNFSELPEEQVTSPIGLKLKKEFKKSIYQPNRFINEKIPEDKAKDLLRCKLPEGDNTKCIDMLTKIVKSSKDGIYKNKHKIGKHGFGRIYPVGGSSLSQIRRSFRHTLADGIYVDIDQENSVFNILKNVAELYDLEHEAISDYINHREDYLKKIMKHYNVSRDVAKKLPITLGYGGGIARWHRENNVAAKDAPAYVTKMKKELNKFMNVIYEKNENKIQKVEGKFHKGTVMSTYIQNIERLLTEACIEFLETKGNNIYDIIPCQDGFMILKENYYDGLIKDCQDYVYEKYKFKIGLKNKPFDEKIEIVIDPDTKIKTYAEVKEEFDKTCVKILKGGYYICTIEGEYCTKKKKELIESFDHMQTIEGQFIQKWIQDPNKRIYNTIGYYPPTIQCPSSHFNLWKDFYITTLTGDYEKKDVALKEILEHILIICGRDKKIYDTLIKYIAHMFKYPHEKPGICPIFTGKHGAGKNLVADIIQALLGDELVLSTPDPGEYVWGKFNTMLANSFLVILEETDGESIKRKDIGKIKNFITNKFINIQGKGTNASKAESRHRCFGLANANDPIPFEKGERRFLVVRTSDEKVGQAEYFSRLYSYLKDKDFLRTFYDYLLEVDVEERLDKLPESEYQNVLAENRRPIIEDWLEEYTKENMGTPTIVEPVSVIFNRFNEWCKEGNFKVNYDIKYFGTQMTLLGLPGVSKPKSARIKQNDEPSKITTVREFDIEKLVKYFKIIDFDENDN